MAGDLLKAFQSQAGSCRKLGSPFTAEICELLAEHLDDSSGFGRRILGWPRDPFADALALRAAAGFHALKRARKSTRTRRRLSPQSGRSGGAHGGG
ncbi:DUF2332 family protein [Kaistia sp. UC242_56]|uniref:DUF2332 family protein n=1 Tax=Kaistia sp. UC242_56 TaxID=3374625 RepID=UPI0037AAAFA2